jgi:hypothetical protein
MVRSWLYTKATLPAKVETIYVLTKRGGEWRIDRFQKRTIKPQPGATDNPDDAQRLRKDH